MRRYDLDWIRVLVFGLLIFYHVGMFFVPWGWHIKNNVISMDMRWPMIFLNQWRLPALFLISGMGTRFALAHRTSGLYIRERLKRLLIPLFFGILIIVPPQLYVERLAYSGYAHDYWHFLLNDCFRGIYPEGNFSWHHLWFLPYLLLFSISLTPVFTFIRDRPESKFLERQRRLLDRSPWNIFLYVLPLIVVEGLIEPFFEVTHALYNDWYTISLYSLIFFYGFNFISLKEAFWTALEKIRVKALCIGVFTFGIYFYLLFLEDNLVKHLVEASFKMLNMWTWLIIIFAFGAKYLNKPSKVLSYCNTAVYPFYIFHQTITVVLAYFIYQSEMSIPLKFMILSIGTLTLSALLYELVKRLRFLRPYVGLK